MVGNSRVIIQCFSRNYFSLTSPPSENFTVLCASPELHRSFNHFDLLSWLLPSAGFLPHWSRERTIS